MDGRCNTPGMNKKYTGNCGTIKKKWDQMELLGIDEKIMLTLP
jgi:hypothetical protein